MPEVIEVLVDGGKATAGPPIGPALGPMEVNIMDVIKAINEATKGFDGMKVPVKIIVDPKTKNFDIDVGTPPASALIMSKIGVEKGSSGGKKVGNLTLKNAIEIAQMKKNLLGSTLKTQVKEIIGTCVSMGVSVEDKNPREVQKEIDNGTYDSLFT
jgi:large subunit ribosomal protein L11